MKILIIFFLIRVSFSIGQVREIVIKSSLDNEVIHNVLIFSENKLIGNSNTFGRAKIDITNLKSIQLVKEDFYDEKNAKILLY